MGLVLNRPAASSVLRRSAGPRLAGRRGGAGLRRRAGRRDRRDRARRVRPARGGRRPGRGRPRVRRDRRRRPRRARRRDPARAGVRGSRGLGAGQLEGELEEEAWIVEPPRREEIFTEDAEGLWAAVLRGKGRRYALLSHDAARSVAELIRPVTAQLWAGSCILMCRQAEPAPPGGVGRGPKRPQVVAGANRRRGRRSAISPREPVSSPRRHREKAGSTKRGRTSIRIGSVPRTERDLGSAALWERSLHRSHRRRIRQAQARRNAPRRNGAALAAGAAILAAPTLSQVTGASASSARPGVTKAEIADKAAVSGSQTWLLSYGDTGEAVAAVQYQLQIPADGIFGPQTEGAVESFQRLQGLAVTGIVDARTWAELFGSKVLFYDQSGGSGAQRARPSSSASIAPAGEKVNVVFGGEPAAAAAAEPAPASSPTGPTWAMRSAARPRRTTGPLRTRLRSGSRVRCRARGRCRPGSERGSRVRCGPGARRARRATPVSTGGDGCSADGRMVAPVNGRSPAASARIAAITPTPGRTSRRRAGRRSARPSAARSASPAARAATA